MPSGLNAMRCTVDAWLVRLRRFRGSLACHNRTVLRVAKPRNLLSGLKARRCTGPSWLVFMHNKVRLMKQIGIDKMQGLAAGRDSASF